MVFRCRKYAVCICIIPLAAVTNEGYSIDLETLRGGGMENLADPLPCFASFLGGSASPHILFFPLTHLPSFFLIYETVSEKNKMCGEGSAKIFHLPPKDLKCNCPKSIW